MPTATSTANKKDIDIPVGFETDPAEDALAREALTTARVALLLKASFFGKGCIVIKSSIFWQHGY